MAESALNALAAQLEDGMSDKLKAYLKTMARFRKYSASNVLLIAMQCPGARHVAGYRTWQRLGRQVRHGERGIAIMAPIVWRTRTEKDDKEQGENGKIVPEEEVRTFKTAHVFDISQTEGKELPEPSRVWGEPNAHLERLKAFVADRGIELAYSDAIGSAEGMSSGGKIVVRQGLEPAAEFSVLVHELAHEMMHHDGGPELAKTMRETEAEAVAFVVCEAIGLDTNTAASDYIKLYQGNKETLLGSLRRIQEAAREIIECFDDIDAQAARGLGVEESAAAGRGRAGAASRDGRAAA